MFSLILIRPTADPQKSEVWQHGNMTLAPTKIAMRLVKRDRGLIVPRKDGKQ